VTSQDDQVSNESEIDEEMTINISKTKKGKEKEFIAKVETQVIEKQMRLSLFEFESETAQEPAPIDRESSSFSSTTNRSIRFVTTPVVRPEPLTDEDDDDDNFAMVERVRKKGYKNESEESLTINLKNV
jgi:hypothetical protein